MRIAQVAPLFIPVPPPEYGGTERVISALTEQLVKDGHEVTLFASGDSQTSGQLVSITPHALYFGNAVNVNAYHVALLTEVYRRAAAFDIIHSHLDYLTLPFAATSLTPSVMTLHGYLDPPEQRYVMQEYPNANYVSISDNQREPLPDVNWVATVYHGVDVQSFPFYPDPGSYLAFIGRISPEKRPDRAIKIAKHLNIPLKIVAKVDPGDRAYFEKEIEPELGNPLISYVSSVSEEEKRAILGKAMALLLPITWREPFGMIYIEALACGTPVLTCPYGSVPELLEEGVTGFVRMTDDELIAAVQRLPEISRAGCRAYAERRFDQQRMARDYIDVYSKLIAASA